MVNSIRNSFNNGSYCDCVNQIITLTRILSNDNKALSLGLLRYAIKLIGPESYLSPKENEFNKIIV